MKKEGCGTHGKFIILSFNNDEEDAFVDSIAALSSIKYFSTMNASDDTPLLHGTLQIVPRQRLVYQQGGTGCAAGDEDRHGAAQARHGY